MKKFFTIAALISAAHFTTHAQQELMISQYMFNELVLNPAYAGSHPYWSAALLHRSQWVGFDEAPVTQTFGIDGQVTEGKQIGLGLTLSNDAHGVIKQQEIGFNGAYRLFLNRGTLSFGLRATIGLYSASVGDVIVWDEDDPVYAADIKSEMVPKFGAGLYYHTEKFYVGFSVPMVYASDKNVLMDQSLVKQYFTNHMYLNAGMVFKPSLAIAVKPSILVKYEAAAPVEVDINCNVLFFNKFWLGAGYRTGDALIAMAEWNITSQLRLGYAYDFTLSEIADYSSGSHEVMLGFDFGKDVNDIKVRSPRYF
ncbi:MAG: type IX secretion system membrane protein PorP/SprF [Flavobacteriales bacterium]|nr:type IX secretion system membrane protein PorP/SprF [Flavobacteriales bacterium]